MVNLKSKTTKSSRKGKRKVEREQTTIRLPKELKKKLQREADQKGISFNAYILILIDTGCQYLQK